MSESPTTNPNEIAEQLSVPMREALMAGPGVDVEAGSGTWFKLQAMGLLDNTFNITMLGEKVVTILLGDYYGARI